MTSGFLVSAPETHSPPPLSRKGQRGRKVLKPVVTGLVWGCVAAAIPAADITVGANVHVSQSRRNMIHNEVVIAADPADPTRLMIGAMTIKKGGGVVVYRSRDGGKSWAWALEEPKGGDPALAYGQGGIVYFSALYPQPKSVHAQLGITHSVDGGHAWAPKVEVTGAVEVTGDWHDRPFLAVDCTEGKFSGRVYCVCTAVVRGMQELGITTSSDAGNSFTTMSFLAVENSLALGTGQPAVLSDGSFVALYRARSRLPHAEPGMFEMRVRWCDTGGRSFFAEHTVAGAGNDDWPYIAMPMMAADPGSPQFKHRLYVVWSQQAAKGTQVFLTRSKDKGHTWSKPTVVSEQSSEQSYDSLLPSVAVSRNGIVGVSWYDGRESRPGAPYSNVRFRASRDGGESWLPSVRVTEVPSPIELAKPVGAIGDRFSRLGDTAGLAADAAGDFHPVWVDKRTGILQVFSAKVMVKGN
jgi:hypothetical protein